MKPTNQNQGPGDVKKLVTADTRRQILQVTEELEECCRYLLGHLKLFNSMREELATAGHSAGCLLTNDHPRTRTAGQPGSARRGEAPSSLDEASDEDYGVPWVVIEQAPWRNAKFLGRWLLAAAQAEIFFREARRDSDFTERAGRAWDAVIHDFGIAAFDLLMKLKRHRTCCALPLDGYGGEGELGEEFVMLVGMGFYKELDSGHYQMTIPTPTLERVKAAVEEYAATEDRRCRLHPELLVVVFPKGEAHARVAELVSLEGARE
jgi:hypothetical protein